MMIAWVDRHPFKEGMEVQNDFAEMVWSLDISQVMPCMKAGQAELKLDS
jgi:hypothetical protein